MMPARYTPAARLCGDVIDGATAMALNAKLCLVACLFFTGGACWLVANVAKPIVNIPTAVAAQASIVPVVARTSSRVPEANPVKRAEKLERPTPTLETAGAQRDAQLDVVAIRDEPVNHAPAVRVQLPPLLVEPVEAMTVAHAEPAARDDASAVRPISNSALLIAQTNLTSPVDAADEVLKPESSTAKITEVTLTTQVPVENDGTYTVKRGDSLSKIAKAMLGSDSQTAIRKLIEANPALKKRPNVLLAGQVLTIPGAVPTSERVAVTANTETETPVRVVAAKSTPTNAKPANAKPAVAAATRKETGSAKRDTTAKRDAVARGEKPADASKSSTARSASASGSKASSATSKTSPKPNTKTVAKADPKKPATKSDGKSTTAKGSDSKAGSAKKAETKAVSAAEKKEKDGKRG